MGRACRFSVVVWVVGSIGLSGNRMKVVGEGAIQEEGVHRVCEWEIGLGACKVDIGLRLER